jgi:putative alpha-1,2-mannosidase
MELGSPIFDKITIHLDPDYYSGKAFVIEAKNNNAKNCYIQSGKLNGKELPNQWIFQDEMTKGGKLELEMGPNPNKNWGN